MIRQIGWPVSGRWSKSHQTANDGASTICGLRPRAGWDLDTVDGEICRRCEKGREKAEARADREHREERVRLEIIGADGVERIAQELEGARRVLARLKRPVGMFGKRHEHEELTAGCGWCGNLQSWSAQVDRLKHALPFAERMEDAIREFARTRTQRATLEEFTRPRRELIRALWREANQPPTERVGR
jgi:hypothetical protein